MPTFLGISSRSCFPPYAPMAFLIEIMNLSAPRAGLLAFRGSIRVKGRTAQQCTLPFLPHYCLV
jgi:hypothetical protein